MDGIGWDWIGWDGMGWDEMGWDGRSAMAVLYIGAKINLYCEAIELVCGGSPRICAVDLLGSVSS